MPIKSHDTVVLMVMLIGNMGKGGAERLIDKYEH